MQTSNLGFEREIIARLLHKLQNVFMRILSDEEVSYNQAIENDMLSEIFIFTLDVIRKRIELLGGIDLAKNRPYKE